MPKYVHATGWLYIKPRIWNLSFDAKILELSPVYKSRFKLVVIGGSRYVFEESGSPLLLVSPFIKFDANTINHHWSMLFLELLFFCISMTSDWHRQFVMQCPKNLSGKKYGFSSANGALDKIRMTVYGNFMRKSAQRRRRNSVEKKKLDAEYINGHAENEHDQIVDTWRI